MSGPIVRTGASPEFTKNWEKIFGGKSTAGKAKAMVAPKKAAAKPVAAKAQPKKTVKKAGKKK